VLTHYNHHQRPHPHTAKKKKTEEEEIQKKHKKDREKGKKEESFYCFCGASFGCELGPASQLIWVLLESCFEGSEEA
jgi:hypothetical protein